MITSGRITAKGFFKFKVKPLPKDYKSEGEEEDSETLKQEKKEMKRYFTDLNNHFDPKKESQDEESIDLLALDQL